MFSYDWAWPWRAHWGFLSFEGLCPVRWMWTNDFATWSQNMILPANACSRSGIATSLGTFLVRFPRYQVKVCSCLKQSWKFVLLKRRSTAALPSSKWIKLLRENGLIKLLPVWFQHRICPMNLLNFLPANHLIYFTQACKLVITMRDVFVRLFVLAG